MAYTRAKMSFGLLGIAAASVAGEQLIEKNGVGNAAPEIAKALVATANIAMELLWLR